MSPAHIGKARPPALAVVVLASFAACSEPVHQPIAYNHKIHVEDADIDCDVCHEGARTGVVAGIPDISICEGCHMEAMGETAEEKKVVQAVADGKEIEWSRLYELMRDTYFSHRRHVETAAIKCERCHGDMASQVRPPTQALVTLMMDDCIECHEQQGADTDCVACHR